MNSTSTSIPLDYRHDRYLSTVQYTFELKVEGHVISHIVLIPRPWFSRKVTARATHVNRDPEVRATHLDRDPGVRMRQTHREAAARATHADIEEVVRVIRMHIEAAARATRVDIKEVVRVAKTAAAWPPPGKLIGSALLR